MEVLEKSQPANMICHFVGIYNKDELIGIALSQFLNLNNLASFGNRDIGLKAWIRKFFLKHFCSHILFMGNNMLSGQNAFYFSENSDPIQVIKTLHLAAIELQDKFKKLGNSIHVTTFKDFDSKTLALFTIPEFESNYRFSTQPNMVFYTDENWKSEEDYCAALHKKYRDQYKRARKKATGIEKRKMNLEDIIVHEKTIYELYYHVAINAKFNTFLLSKNHFRVFKELFKDNFLFYGYFLNDKLIAFNTLIKNGSDLDTYFLGYDESIQKDKMVYLNMLYDMIGFAIHKRFKRIIFARTALEIKSSVGAKPEELQGLMEHSTPFINKKIGSIFSFLEPKIIWKERNPFK